MMISGKYSLSPRCFFSVVKKHVFHTGPVTTPGPAVDMWALGVAGWISVDGQFGAMPGRWVYICKDVGKMRKDRMDIACDNEWYNMLPPCQVFFFTCAWLGRWADPTETDRAWFFSRCWAAGAIKVDAAAKGWWQKEALTWQERSLSVCRSVSCNNRGFSHNMRNQSYNQNLHGAMTSIIHGIST